VYRHPRPGFQGRHLLRLKVPSVPQHHRLGVIRMVSQTLLGTFVCQSHGSSRMPLCVIHWEWLRLDSALLPTFYATPMSVRIRWLKSQYSEAYALGDLAVSKGQPSADTSCPIPYRERHAAVRQIPRRPRLEVVPVPPKKHKSADRLCDELDIAPHS
jgi:hypothetical protein